MKSTLLTITLLTVACDAAPETLREADDPCTYIDEGTVVLHATRVGIDVSELALPEHCADVTIAADGFIVATDGRTQLADEDGMPLPSTDGIFELDNWYGTLVVVEPIPCDPSSQCCLPSKRKIWIKRKPLCVVCPSCCL